MQNEGDITTKLIFNLWNIVLEKFRLHNVKVKLKIEYMCMSLLVNIL